MRIEHITMTTTIERRYFNSKGECVPEGDRDVVEMVEIEEDSETHRTVQKTWYYIPSKRKLETRSRSPLVV